MKTHAASLSSAFGQLSVKGGALEGSPAQRHRRFNDSAQPTFAFANCFPTILYTLCVSARGNENERLLISPERKKKSLPPSRVDSFYRARVFRGLKNLIEERRRSAVLLRDFSSLGLGMIVMAYEKLLSNHLCIQ